MHSMQVQRQQLCFTVRCKQRLNKQINFTSWFAFVSFDIIETFDVVYTDILTVWLCGLQADKSQYNGI